MLLQILCSIINSKDKSVIKFVSVKAKFSLIKTKVIIVIEKTHFYRLIGQKCWERIGRELIKWQSKNIPKLCFSVLCRNIICIVCAQRNFNIHFGSIVKIKRLYLFVYLVMFPLYFSWSSCHLFRMNCINYCSGLLCRGDNYPCHFQWP